MKQAIRAGRAAIRDGDFFGHLLGKRNLELLDLYLDSCPAAAERIARWSGVGYPRSTALVKSQARKPKADYVKNLRSVGVEPGLVREFLVF
jgi:hypothetical protein